MPGADLHVRDVRGQDPELDIVGHGLFGLSLVLPDQGLKPLDVQRVASSREREAQD